MTDYYKSHQEDAVDTAEMALINLINAHRATLSLPPIALSKALTTTAARHVVDLMDNQPGLEPDALHGWSDAPYSALDPATYKSVLRAPERLGTGYTADAFEILIGVPSSGALGAWAELTTRQALDLFLSSPPHRALIESSGDWSGEQWGAIGVAIRGGYVSVWFGFSPDTAAPAFVAHDDPVGIGTDRDVEIFRGSTEFAQDDVFLGAGGRNVFQASGGDDLFVAGPGQDQTEFRGSMADYQVTVESGMIRVTDTVDGRDGSTLLVNFGSDDWLIFFGDGRLSTAGAVGGDKLLQYDIGIGGPGADRFTGRAGNDLATMGDGNDVVHFTGGNDVVFGGAGFDILVINGPAKEFKVSQVAAGGYEVQGAADTVQMNDVELLVFGDQVMALSRPGTLFDASYYLAKNPDVAAAGINPLDHFSLYGWREGRDPSPFFDTSAYLTANPDVAAAGINPLDHFSLYGWAEHRSVSPTQDYWI
jgi:RTX calcium-binding nonapeptide repeat (4 copies)